MFKIVLVAALAALAVDARFLLRVPQLDGRIVGGHDAQIEDFPYQVSVQRHGRHFCGGSIIARNIILTAARCTHSRPGTSTVSPTILSIRYGSSLRNQGGTVINVSEVLQHPRYNQWTYDYDISLLKLDGSVLLSPQAQRVNLVPLYLQEGGRSAKVTGWGRIEEGGPLSEQLQVVEVQEVERNACNSSLFGTLTERMMCFTDVGKDACEQDTGGPLVYQGRQIGVVSWGEGCADPAYPGVYSNIGNEDIREYIDSNVRAHATK